MLFIALEIFLSKSLEIVASHRKSVESKIRAFDILLEQLRYVIVINKNICRNHHEHDISWDDSSSRKDYAKQAGTLVPGNTRSSCNTLIFLKSGSLLKVEEEGSATSSHVLARLVWPSRSVIRFISYTWNRCRRSRGKRNGEGLFELIASQRGTSRTNARHARHRSWTVCPITVCCLSSTTPSRLFSVWQTAIVLFIRA